MSWILGGLWFALKSVGFLVVLLLGVGVIRLFLARHYTYDASMTDPALLRRGDILLTGKQSVWNSTQIQLANVLTRKLKHRFWTHAAISQGNGRVWEAQPQGIIERDLKDYLDGGYYLRAFRHRYIQDADTLNRLMTWCASEKGDAYDWRGVIFYAISILIPVGLNFVFDNSSIAKLFHVQENYFCSELVVDAFEAIGFPLSPFDGWRVKPTDFISNPVLEEVPVTCHPTSDPK